MRVRFHIIIVLGCEIFRDQRDRAACTSTSQGGRVRLQDPHQASQAGQQGEVAQVPGAELQGGQPTERVEVGDGHGNMRQVLNPQLAATPAFTSKTSAQQVHVYKLLLYIRMHQIGHTP